MAIYNEYFCFIDETKLTEEEWNKVHAEEVADPITFLDTFGYYHCYSYVAYSASFDRCMEMQIMKRGWLREWYVKLMKAPFDDSWAEQISDFSDDFKSIYGRHPRFIDDMLAKKGVTRKDLHDAWDRINEMYKATSDLALVTEG